MKLGWDISLELFTAYGAILSLAVIPIYIGAKRALSSQTSHSQNQPYNPDVNVLPPQQETMSSKDAWMFPFVGSAVLFGLYILFKVFSKEYINLLLSGYFLLFGFGALSTTLSPWLEALGHICFGKPQKSTPYKISFSLFKEKIELEFTFFDIIAWGFGLALSLWYAYEKHWIANNVIALAFCIQAIGLISLGSYKIGCILLCGLFVYDIFWVFGTDVMVTVAKSFDAPVKLLFPRNLLSVESKYEFSMLGLGDIVIPGIFLALLLRFDSHRQLHRKNFSPVYFWVSFVSYFLGLTMTIVVMHVFRAAQPALLYLVPACLGSSFLTAIIREELGLLLAYSEEAKEESKSSKKKKKKQSQSQQASGEEPQSVEAPAAPTPKKAKKAKNPTQTERPQASQQQVNKKKTQPQQQQNQRAAKAAGGRKK